MSKLSHERLCDEIIAQTDLLRSTIAGADLTTPVSSCPDWNTGQLLRHLGGGQRWAAKIVQTRAQEPVPDDDFRDLSPYANEKADVVGPWLAEGAAMLADALRSAGPDADVWTPVPGARSAFYARRFTHETLIHRADATLALGAEFVADPEVAEDAFDEWLELGSLPLALEYNPKTRELLGPGRTLHFHATDGDGEWVVDLTGDLITWRRGHEKCTVAVRGPLTELLLVLYRRRPVSADGVEVLGDAKLLDFYLERVSFG